MSDEQIGKTLLTALFSGCETFDMENIILYVYRMYQTYDGSIFSITMNT